MDHKTKASKSRIMKLAWFLKRQAIKEAYAKGTGVQRFSKYMAIAWEAVKKWSGEFVETVTVGWTDKTGGIRVTHITFRS